jgi:hypothetical protein
VGLSPDRRWYLVEFDGRQGWVRDSSLIRVEGDLGAVEIIRGAGTGTRVLFTDDFEDGELDGWSSWGGQVDIVNDDGDHVLRLSSPGPDQWTGTAPDQNVQGDYSVSARIKLVRTQSDFADAFIRVRVGETYGVDTYIASQGYVGIGFYQGDNWQPYGDKEAPIRANTWYLLRTDVTGDLVRVFLDGQMIVSATIDNLPDGGFELGIAPTAEIYVDAVGVRALDPAALEAAPKARLTANANIRLGPGQDQPVIAGARTGDVVIVLGRSPDRTWMLIRQNETGVQGWIATGLLEELE